MTLRPAFASLLILFGAAPLAAADPTDAKSPRIEALVKAVTVSGEAGKRATADFWAEFGATGGPIVEPADTPDMMLVSFVARAGADRGANPSVMLLRTTDPLTPLRQVPGTDVWSTTLKVSRASRSLYMFAWPQGRTPDPASAMVMPTRQQGVQELFADPQAGRVARGSIRLGMAAPDEAISWFEGPAAPPEPYIGPAPASARGALVDHDVASDALKGSRRVTVYTPAGARASGGRLLILFDAEQYIGLMSTPAILDNMIAQRIIPPVTVAFVHSGATRMADLTPNARYQAFLRTELLPYLRRPHRVSADPAKVAIGGFSHGALAAVSAALADPGLYGNVIAQSGSFWWSPDLRPPLDPRNPMPLEANVTAATLTATPMIGRNIRFYMDVGSWEGVWQISTNRQVRDLLKARGNAVTYAEFEGGHDYIAWRSTLPNALKAIFGTVPTARR